eukprot:s1421_g6.t2
MSPLDPCLFVLTDASTGFVHGAIGMHVDDGLCFGDSMFDKALAQLESRFPFGSKRERDFLFTGIHIYQDEFYNIHLSQSEYTLGIDPIHVDRHRRKNETETVTETERQSLRGVIGSLQYAATNSRPDLSAKLSFLQSRINCATIADLLDANRLLGEAKKYSDTTITISSIPEEKVRIVAYSDASFASRAKQQSQKGDIFHQKSAMASPLVWYSKKIERVVASTLAAETFALSSAEDAEEDEAEDEEEDEDEVEVEDEDEDEDEVNPSRTNRGSSVQTEEDAEEDEEEDEDEDEDEDENEDEKEDEDEDESGDGVDFDHEDENDITLLKIRWAFEAFEA